MLKSPINDVTTDLEHPPSFVFLSALRGEKKYRYPQHFAPIQQQLHPLVHGLESPLIPELTFRLVVELAQEQKWIQIGQDIENRSVEYTARTPLLGFKDDIVIQVRDHNNASIVHMRSKSRVGRSDLGANAMRIQEFFYKLKQKIDASER